VPMIVGSAVRQMLAIHQPPALRGPDSDFTSDVPEASEQWGRSRGSRG